MSELYGGFEMLGGRNAFLCERLKSEKILMAPGAHDVLCAKIFEKAGFEALYMSGFATSASILGRPDVGLITYNEMLDRAAAMADCVAIPIIADGDTGYGNAVNVYRTVQGYERAGVSCIQLEDQVAPKKCGHMTGRQVIPVEEMVGKIHAACDARYDENFRIMIRTDARTVFGIDAAIERALSYEEAGADILFIESPESVEEMRQIASACHVPTVANMVEFGRSPLYSAEELEQMGYKIVIMPVTSTFIIAKAITEAAESIKRKGSSKHLLNQAISFDAFVDILGLREVKDMERRYMTGRDD